jgi:hypothetical protein
MCLLTLWPIARALCWAWRRRLRKVERLKNEKLADVELCDVRRASSLWWSAGRGAHEPCARRCACRWAGGGPDALSGALPGRRGEVLHRRGAVDRGREQPHPLCPAHLRPCPILRPAGQLTAGCGACASAGQLRRAPGHSPAGRARFHRRPPRARACRASILSASAACGALRYGTKHRNPCGTRPKLCHVLKEGGGVRPGMAGVLLLLAQDLQQRRPCPRCSGSLAGRQSPPAMTTCRAVIGCCVACAA